LEVEIEDNRVVQILGDRNHPLTGGFTCTKGRHSGDLTTDPSRFLTAQRRRAGGGLEPMDTDQAIAEVGSSLRAIVERYGADAVGLWPGTQANCSTLGVRTVGALRRSLGTRKLFTPLTIDQAPKGVAAQRLGAWLGGVQRFEDSDVWMFVGYNPLVSMMGGWMWGFSPQNGVSRLREAKRRGMKIIVVDPRQTETAKFADLHLQLRPGTDALLFASLLHVVLRDGLEDRDFCTRFAEGGEQLRAAVREAAPEQVAARVGVDADAIVLAARWFATARRGMVSTGTGANMGAEANLVEHLAGCLNTVCGRWARAGDLVAAPPTLNAVERWTVDTVYTPNRPPAALGPPREGVVVHEAEQGWQSRVRGGTPLFFGELPAAMLPDEILEPGDDRLRALIVVGGNPAVALPDQERTVQALSKLDLLVSVEPYPTATARLSHYVLAPALQLERADHTAHKELTIGSPFAQYTPALLKPAPGVREDWEYVFALAHALDLELELFGRTFKPRDALPSSDELLAASVEGGRVSLDEVKRHAGGHLYDELPPMRVQPAEPGAGKFRLLPPDVAAELDAALSSRPSRRPFALVVRRAKEAMNSTGTRTPGLSRRSYNPCFVHPADLSRLALVGGDQVRITSDHGSMPAIVEPDRTLRPGVVAMTHHFGGLPDDDDGPDTGSNTGRLVSAFDGIQAFSGQPQTTAVPITIEPLAVAESPGAGG
jgi:anaerobic selenocysteine-containing dehydrogenase